MPARRLKREVDGSSPPGLLEASCRARMRELPDLPDAISQTMKLHLWIGWIGAKHRFGTETVAYPLIRLAYAAVKCRLGRETPIEIHVREVFQTPARF